MVVHVMMLPGEFVLVGHVSGNQIY